VTTDNLFLSQTIQEVLIDSMQTKYFYFTDYTSSKVYYAVADSLNTLKVQKKVDVPLRGTDNTETRLNILSSDAWLSITALSVSDNNSQIDYFSLLQKDTGASCFGVDTSFL
jgi:hypothetical protein